MTETKDHESWCYRTHSGECVDGPAEGDTAPDARDPLMQEVEFLRAWNAGYAAAMAKGPSLGLRSTVQVIEALRIVPDDYRSARDFNDGVDAALEVLRAALEAQS